MYFRFENLEVWKLAKDFAGLIYSITRNFPDTEKFGMVTQLRRASISISMNIAEGSDRKSDNEFIRFLRCSIGSLEEVVTVLYIALDQRYINKKEFDESYKKSNELMSKINSLINSLRSNSKY